MDDVQQDFPARLYWAGFRGFIRVGGHQARLPAPPKLGGLQMDAVDYIPGVLAQIMPHGEGWRDMTRAEMAEADALLGRDDGTVCVVFDSTARPPARPTA